MTSIYYPSLSELPPSPPGKTGWPWTEGIEQLPDMMPDGTPWPRISIITPSFNQGQFIEETIRSVLLQGYPNLEYIIIDGGSTDGTVDVIRKYESWLTYWVSEPDQGQSDAINKGWERATGTWTNWINSDDLLAPGALTTIGLIGRQSQLYTILAGDVINFDSYTGRKQTIRPRGINLVSIIRFWERSCIWHQPGLFLPKAALDRMGYLDVSLHYVMDYDLLCRLLSICKVIYLNKPIALFRLHGDAKGISQPEKTTTEHIIMARRYWFQTGIPRWKNEFGLKLWLLRAMGSAVKRRHWAALRVVLKSFVME